MPPGTASNVVSRESRDVCRDGSGATVDTRIVGHFPQFPAAGEQNCYTPGPRSVNPLSKTAFLSLA